jgi:hypothetical protein
MRLYNECNQRWRWRDFNAKWFWSMMAAATKQGRRSNQFVRETIAFALSYCHGILVISAL